MKNKLKYIIPSLITFVILGIIYYFNGLYPFGDNPLVQVDADYLYIPALYKVYDFLHGTGNLFYTDIGFGNSLYASLIIQRSLFSPLNLLLFFVKRDNIVNLYGLFIMIKLCLVTLTCYIYIDKTHKVNYFYKVLFSILYTFNGFVILNYFNEIWLDIVILFPLLVLYLKRLLEKEDCLGYIIILSLCFIITFYFSYFIVLFILLYSFIYLNLYKKKKVKETIFKLGISTFIAFLISGFSSLPLMYQILNSARFNFDTYTGMFSTITMKSLYLLFSPFLIIIFIKLLTKFKKDKVNIYGYLILILLYIIPVIIDPINALLHGGSYWAFPYRYGYVTTFILMDACLYYFAKYDKNKEKNIFIRDIILSIWIIIFGIIGYNLNCTYRNNIITEGILLEISNAVYGHIVHMILIAFAMYLLILFIKNKWFKYIAIGVVSLYSVFLFTTWTFYYNSGYFLCTNAEELYSNMKMETDGRYKMGYNVYTPYFGFIFKVPTLDNWLHIIPEKKIYTYQDLGYYVTDTNVHSVGGTIFTDHLFNFKYMLSNDDKLNDDMFSLVDSYNYKYLLKYNYPSSYGVVFDKLEKIKKYNVFDYQNRIYQNLYNTDKKIIDYKEYEYDDKDEYMVSYKINKEGYLYFYAEYYYDIESICIDNDCQYEVDNYVRYLGYYNKDVGVKIKLKNNNHYINFMLGFINKDDIMNIKSDVKYKDNKYYVDVDNEKYLFLPINNIKGLHVYNNDKEVKVYEYLGNFVCIKLNKGENVIKIKYELPLFKLGMIFSILGLVLLCLYKKIVPNKLILNIAYWVFNLVILGVFIYYYFYSLFKYIV